MRTDDLIEILIRDPVFVRAFHARVDRTAGCWNWTQSLDQDGYGKLNTPKALPFKTTVRAHRFALCLSAGHVDRARLALHSCNNRKCCNPSHLRFGTVSENMQDMLHDGNAGSAKLNHDSVRAVFSMRADGLTLAQIGKALGVSSQTVSQTLMRKRWASVIL